MLALKEMFWPLSCTLTVILEPLLEPVTVAVGAGFEPNSWNCAWALISARRQVHADLLLISVPSMERKGSGKSLMVAN